MPNSSNSSLCISFLSLLHTKLVHKFTMFSDVHRPRLLQLFTVVLVPFISFGFIGFSVSLHSGYHHLLDLCIIIWLFNVISL